MGNIQTHLRSPRNIKTELPKYRDSEIPSKCDENNNFSNQDTNELDLCDLVEHLTLNSKSFDLDAEVDAEYEITAGGDQLKVNHAKVRDEPLPKPLPYFISHCSPFSEESPESIIEISSDSSISANEIIEISDDEISSEEFESDLSYESSEEDGFSTPVDDSESSSESETSSSDSSIEIIESKSSVQPYKHSKKPQKKFIKKTNSNYKFEADNFIREYYRPLERMFKDPPIFGVKR